MSDKLVTIAEYMDSAQAEMAKQILEDFEIKAMVLDQNTSNLAFPTLPWATVKLQVLESDAAKAMEILESQEPAFTQEEMEDLDDTDEFGETEEPEEENN